MKSEQKIDKINREIREVRTDGDSAWDFKNALELHCSRYVMSKDKKHMRIVIPSRRELEDRGIDVSHLLVPDRPVVIELNEKCLNKLRQLLKDDK